MKVDLSSAAVRQLPAEQNVKTAVKPGTDSDAANTDRTTLLSNAAVHSLVSRALQLPAVRQSAVEALRQQVNSGAYRPAASKTAAAITSNDR